MFERDEGELEFVLRHKVFDEGDDAFGRSELADQDNAGRPEVEAGVFATHTPPPVEDCPHALGRVQRGAPAAPAGETHFHVDALIEACDRSPEARRFVVFVDAHQLVAVEPYPPRPPAQAPTVIPPTVISVSRCREPDIPPRTCVSWAYVPEMPPAVQPRRARSPAVIAAVAPQISYPPTAKTRTS